MKTGIFGPGEGWRPPQVASWPDEYERGRPDWPAEVAEIAGLGPESVALELGAGTGKLTRVLALKFPQLIAVEPAASMRALLATTCPAVEVLAGSAEEIPIADRSVGGVFVAEAFHRFNAEPALVEIARVLIPRGVLVLMWNVPGGPGHPDLAAAEGLLLQRAPGSREELGYDPVDLSPARVESGEWQAPFATSRFGEIQERRILHTQTLDRDGLVSFYASMGWMAYMPEVEREALLNEVRSLLREVEYERLWETRLYWTSLR